MTGNKPSDESTDDFKDAADKSLNAGIADESAAYEKANGDEEDSDLVEEGHWKSTDDGSGTSETD